MQFYALGVQGMLTTTRRGLTERRRAVYHSGDNQTRHSRRGPNHICVYCPPPDARRGPKHICVYCPPINPNPQQGHAAGPLADDVLPLHPWPKTQIASAYTGLSDPSTYKDTQLAAGLALLSLTAALAAVLLRPDAHHPCIDERQLANPPNPPSLDPQRLATNKRHATNGRRISSPYLLRSEPPWRCSP